MKDAHEIRKAEIERRMLEGEPIGDIPALLRKVDELTTSRDCWRTIAEGREKEIHARIDDIERLKKELALCKFCSKNAEEENEWLEKELADARILAQRDSRPSNHQCSDT